MGPGLHLGLARIVQVRLEEVRLGVGLVEVLQAALHVAEHHERRDDLAAQLDEVVPVYLPGAFDVHDHLADLYGGEIHTRVSLETGGRLRSHAARPRTVLHRRSGRVRFTRVGHETNRSREFGSVGYRRHTARWCTSNVRREKTNFLR